MVLLGSPGLNLPEHHPEVRVLLFSALRCLSEPDCRFEGDNRTFGGTRSRVGPKRNILFPSGVKLCSQETLDQAVSNHLTYFHLRGTSRPVRRSQRSQRSKRSQRS
uniref:Uncharacterized protein n=1 Tax=Oryzias sinensis TaxID=183150 RepID=A0A8C7YMI0_9TELE